MKALAGALTPLMPSGGSIVGLDFDASVAWPIYDWMGVAKAALESVSRYLARDLGPSGVHGELSLDTTGLLGEMDRYFVKSALVSHWTAEEYDAAVGNDALERDLHHRFMPAWSMVPDDDFLQTLSSRSVSAVRLTPTQHNFSLDTWCAGPMLDYLQQNAIVTLVARSDIAWSDIATLLENFPRLPLVLLETGYRSDRYLFPLLKKFPSLYFDSATYLAHRQLEYFVEKHGPDRILFGSRLPLFTPAAAMDQRLVGTLEMRWAELAMNELRHGL